MARESSHPDCYAVNSVGQQIHIGPVPGVGDVIGYRKVETQVGDKIYGIPHAIKLDADGTPVEWRATVSGWVMT